MIAVDRVFRKSVRTAMTYFPGLVDHKAALQRSWRRMRRGFFEPDFQALPGLLQRFEMCLDIGSNRGQSIDALKRLGLGLDIRAFEPQSDLYDSLMKRFALDRSVEVFPYGVGARASDDLLYVPYYNGFKFDGLASLDEKEARNWLVNRLYCFDPRKLDVKQIACRTIRLDDLAFESRVAFIKMDIQGTELDALAGGMGLLRSDRPLLLLESPRPEIYSLLSELGYSPYAYVSGELVEAAGRATQNVFFLA